MTLELRIATPEDAAGILSIYGPYCTSTKVSFEMAAPSEAEMRQRIERVLEKHPWLVVDAGGGLAGYVYASQHRERPAYRWAVDVAVYIADGHQRRGVGRALYTSLFAILREQGYFKAYAGITLPNAASVGLHKSLGFRQAAVFPKTGYKLGEWHDVGWWQYDLRDPISSPTEPVDFRTLSERDLLAAALAEGQRLLELSRRA